VVVRIDRPAGTVNAVPTPLMKRRWAVGTGVLIAPLAHGRDHRP